MIYFIPWVVFLLVVILSVPIANWLDKRKLRQAAAEDAGADEIPRFEGDAEAEPAGEAGSDDVAVFEPAGGAAGDDQEDEFAAFG
jgi:hypothetical protein